MCLLPSSVRPIGIVLLLPSFEFLKVAAKIRFLGWGRGSEFDPGRLLDFGQHVGDGLLLGGRVKQSFLPALEYGPDFGEGLKIPYLAEDAFNRFERFRVFGECGSNIRWERIVLLMRVFVDLQSVGSWRRHFCLVCRFEFGV